MALITRPGIAQMVGELCDASSFTYDQCQTIVDYFWDLSEDCGEDMEFCPVTIRCDVNYYTWKELVEQYCIFGGEGSAERLWDLTDSDDIEEIADQLRDHTLVIDHDDDGVLFFAF